MPPTKNQIDFADRLRKKRLDLGFSLQEVADKVGISKVTLSRYETLDITNIPSDKIERLAEIYKTTPAYIMGWEKKEAVKEFKITVPLLGKVACGIPIEAIGDTKYITIDEKCDYCLVAEGDSMTGVGVNHGDLIYMNKADNLENGDIGAIAIGDDITLKRFYYYREQNIIILRAANPNYEDQVYSGDMLKDVKIIGKAKFLTRKYYK